MCSILLELLKVESLEACKGIFFWLMMEAKLFRLTKARSLLMSFVKKADLFVLLISSKVFFWLISSCWWSFKGLSITWDRFWLKYSFVYEVLILTFKYLVPSVIAFGDTLILSLAYESNFRLEFVILKGDLSILARGSFFTWLFAVCFLSLSDLVIDDSSSRLYTSIKPYSVLIVSSLSP